MNIYFFIFIIFIIGIISTGVGGVLAAIFDLKSKKAYCIIYQLTAGIMTAIVCFSMLNESYSLSNIIYCVIGTLCGAIILYFIEKKIDTNGEKNSISIGMALHNIVEGLSIGISYKISNDLGSKILFAIALHNIFEGGVIGIVNKKSIKKNFINAAIVGAFMGIGATFLLIPLNYTNNMIGILLAIASGAMLYIVSCELLINANKLIIKKALSMYYILGIVIGMLFCLI